MSTNYKKIHKSNTSLVGQDQQKPEINFAFYYLQKGAYNTMQ